MSVLFSGYAVFGLETPLFLLLTLAGTELFFREEDAASDDGGARSALVFSSFPWFPLSGAVFALAALTRPEAPLFLGLLVVWHSEQALSRRSVLRLVAFALPVAAHLVWRHSYYGAWLPNTLAAKTGDFAQQIQSGADYVRKYAQHAGTFLRLGLLSVASSIVHRRRSGPRDQRRSRCSSACTSSRVGGDWMPYFRFLAPAEPFAFLLADDAVRAIAARRERVASLAIAALRRDHDRDPRRRARAGPAEHPRQRQGLLGRCGRALRGVARPERGAWPHRARRHRLRRLPHGLPGRATCSGCSARRSPACRAAYTHKVGAGYTDAIFAKNPRYFLLIASGIDCRNSDGALLRRLVRRPQVQGRTTGPPRPSPSGRAAPGASTGRRRISTSARRSARVAGACARLALRLAAPSPRASRPRVVSGRRSSSPASASAARAAQNARTSSMRSVRRASGRLSSSTRP